MRLFHFLVQRERKDLKGKVGVKHKRLGCNTYTNDRMSVRYGVTHHAVAGASVDMFLGPFDIKDNYRGEGSGQISRNN